MTTSVGQTSNEIVALGKTVAVGALLSTTAGNKMLLVKGYSYENIKGNFESAVDKDRHESGNEGFSINTQKDVNKHSTESMKYNSGKGTRQN